ncbi:uncharacterized protein [Montipora capricornis]|uniref:uncharacterized protein n=1 Tax=Montipora capricornis TaxID=246305 RepID=UPI0035F1A42D
MIRVGSLVRRLTFFVWTLHVSTRMLSATHDGRYGKYFPRKLNAEVTQRGPRRNGILESVQTFPTPTAPAPLGNENTITSVRPTEHLTKPYPLKAKFAVKAKFSSVINDHPVTSNDPGISKTINGPHNLVSYSLDPPNSFPQPTSIPAIDTLSATLPTPMGSIEREMNDVGMPFTMPPITNEMSNEEKIPGLEGISTVEPIPLDFAEESPWERSNATTGAVTAVTSSHFHAENARRRDNVAVKLRHQTALSTFHSASFKFGTKGQRNSDLLKVVDKHRKPAGYSKSLPIKRESKKRVYIPPPKPIDPIQPLLKDFQKEKDVGDIAEHVLDFETIKPHEAIDEKLLSVNTQPEIGPIQEHLKTDPLDTIEPIENHQI